MYYSCLPSGRGCAVIVDYLLGGDVELEVALDDVIVRVICVVIIAYFLGGDVQLEVVLDDKNN